MSVEHEKSLLGAILVEPSILDGERVTVDRFTDHRHIVLFNAMAGLREAGKPVTALSLADELGVRSTEAGGVSYIASLGEIPTAANADYYLGVLCEETRRRELQRLSRLLEAGLHDDKGSEELIGTIEAGLLTLRKRADVEATVTPREALHAIIEKAEARSKAGSTGPTGIPSGFPQLDVITGGFQPGDLILVAARTSIGKSALALTWIDYQIRRNLTIALASLEMSAVQVYERLIAMRSIVPTGRFRFGQLDTDDLRAICGASTELESCGLRILDRPDLSVRVLRSWAAGEVAHGTRILYLDYAGLLRGDNETSPRWEQMAVVSRGLKAIARELRVPLVCLAQLNREAADAREPGLHNIRDSGALEQDADLVFILTRSEKDSVDDSVPGVLKIAKHRNGQTVERAGKSGRRSNPRVRCSRIGRIIHSCLRRRTIVTLGICTLRVGGTKSVRSSWRSIMLVAVKRPRIKVDIHGPGEELVAEVLKERFPGAEISPANESVPYRETAFAKEMRRKATPGRRLWVYRDNAGLTLNDLAVKAGITKSHFSAMENDKRAIGVLTAKKLGKALKCDYRRFL
jgi:replicative DNA helicase